MRRFYASLRDALHAGPIALATVVRAEGSTPRRAGAQLYVAPDQRFVGTIGGGTTEARVLELAEDVLRTGGVRTFDADLRGRPGEIRDGICGGTMTVRVQRLDMAKSGAAVDAVLAELTAGRTVTVSLTDGLHLGRVDGGWTGAISPDPRVLIVGAGHIGRALARLAGALDFCVSVCDERPDWLEASAFPPDCDRETSVAAAVGRLGPWQGGRFAVLVTRGFREDLAALAALRAVPHWTYVGLLGSRRRVAAVLAEFPERPWGPEVLHAPVGLSIGAETPEEIAVSIAAEMVRVRRLLGPDRGAC